MGGEPIRVLVADDHPLYREGVARAIRERAELSLLGLCGNGRAALSEIREQTPDVALVDVKLPGLSGIQVVRAVKREDLPTRVLLLSAFTDGALVYEALAAGAAGYLTKDAGRRDICEGVARAARGETVLSPGLNGGLVAQIRQRATDEGPRLTGREREILTLTADGCSAPEIGRRLYLSPTTVKTHLQHTYEKLGVSDRAAAVAEAMRRQILD